MKTQTHKCKFYDTEFELIIISEYPKLIEVKDNLTYKLNLKQGIELDQEFSSYSYLGKSNHKTYKEYTDKKGNYIKYSTGTSIKPSCIKIYKD